MKIQSPGSFREKCQEAEKCESQKSTWAEKISVQHFKDI